MKWLTGVEQTITISVAIIIALSYFILTNMDAGLASDILKDILSGMAGGLLFFLIVSWTKRGVWR